MKHVAVYPGTFDPVTNGHLDLVERSLTIFDEVIIAVAENPKKAPLFSLQDRLSLFRAVTSHYNNIVIEGFDGLLVDYVRKKNAVAIIRGLRAVSDFEYEMQMALMNRRLDNKIETVFLMPNEEYSFITSTIVKEAASYGGDVSSLVPGVVVKKLREKFGR
ncbi:MAG: pantetheine-phosphate adenylyltransferase [Nitrospirae bacterium GWD2_57_9]|nr:MAG: pantetheine-phosphate adenylyltransferase [Nitrospirae bacterium GWD2_57_9]OGW46682.1 MAG: pantetheine-phosphate adenylyltransferase [Nitrospirae bacterium GWC2_57_9]